MLSLLNTTIISLALLTIFPAANKESLTSKKVGTGLQISKDGHSLLKDGKPYFWLGDTGWLLLTQSPEDVEYYFEDRVAKGFNTIQIEEIWNKFFNIGLILSELYINSIINDLAEIGC